MDLRGCIVAHNKVVAVGLLDLVDGYGFREGRDTPVGDAADDTAVAKDESADCLGNFLDLGKGARTDLLRELLVGRQRRKKENRILVRLTIAMSS